MTVTQTLTYRCGAPGCDAEHVQPTEVYRGGVPMVPWTPDGWCAVGDSYFCPRHAVALYVDFWALDLSEGGHIGWYRVVPPDVDPEPAVEQRGVFVFMDGRPLGVATKP